MSTIILSSLLHEDWKLLRWKLSKMITSLGDGGFTHLMHPYRKMESCTQLKMYNGVERETANKKWEGGSLSWASLEHNILICISNKYNEWH